MYMLCNWHTCLGLVWTTYLNLSYVYKPIVPGPRCPWDILGCPNLSHLGHCPVSHVLNVPSDPGGSCNYHYISEFHLHVHSESKHRCTCKREGETFIQVQCE